MEKGVQFAAEAPQQRIPCVIESSLRRWCTECRKFAGNIDRNPTQRSWTSLGVRQAESL